MLPMYGSFRVSHAWYRSTILVKVAGVTMWNFKKSYFKVKKIGLKKIQTIWPAAN